MQDIRIALKVFFLSILTVVPQYLSRSSELVLKLQASGIRISEDIEVAKAILFIIGVALGAIFLSANLAIKESRLHKALEQQDALIETIKADFVRQIRRDYRQVKGGSRSQLPELKLDILIPAGAAHCKQVLYRKLERFPMITKVCSVLPFLGLQCVPVGNRSEIAGQHFGVGIYATSPIAHCFKKSEALKLTDPKEAICGLTDEQARIIQHWKTWILVPDIKANTRRSLGGKTYITQMIISLHSEAEFDLDPPAWDRLTEEMIRWSMTVGSCFGIG